MAQKSNKLYDKVIASFPQLGWKKILEINSDNPANLYAYRDKKTGKVVQAIVSKTANCKQTVISTLSIALSKVFSKVKLGAMIKSLEETELTETTIDAMVTYATGKPSTKNKVESIISTANNGKENPTI